MVDAARGCTFGIVNSVAMIVRGPRRGRRGHMVEVRIDGVRDLAYDEDVHVTVTGPAGLTTAMPAFWRADEEGVGWYARFTPPLAGMWELVAIDGTVRSAPLRITVTGEAARGFARVDAGGFRYENGEPFVPIGADLPGDADLDGYRSLLAGLARNGATATRLRLSSDTTVLVDRARLVDKVFELADRHGIAVMVTLGDRLCPVGEEYLARLRYIGARWAAYTSVWSWQWWDDSGANDAALAAWLDGMTPHLRTADPYGHPVTTGYDSRIKTAIWGRPELDFASCRLAAAPDPVILMPALAGKQRRIAAGKPVVLNHAGTESDHLYAAVFSGFAGVLAEPGFDRGLPSLAGARLAGLTPAVPLKGAVLALIDAGQALIWVRAPLAFTVRGLADGPYAAVWSTVDGAAGRTEQVVAVRGAVRLSASAPALVRLSRITG